MKNLRWPLYAVLLVYCLTNLSNILNSHFQRVIFQARIELLKQSTDQKIEALRMSMLTNELSTQLQIKSMLDLFAAFKPATNGIVWNPQPLYFTNIQMTNWEVFQDGTNSTPLLTNTWPRRQRFHRSDL